ncbi:flagellar assembly factor FliW [Aequitasia blattaphilus]|uniref:Flagellar assembly factor FliW n=1 Tax=Aequitasia blattaphilus TaxID=2949332 RepID=A0ABT1E9M2_9FIRM|nr:flagellar assembly protein FliW [Aequitasia blattaphilus]MCP1102544.1 flagellar assembly protein FliW [Aequitasia blattaphilus]MCR8615184.1 flagellar assembly protein FliW [Aequitasia blattaphilus]
MQKAKDERTIYFPEGILGFGEFHEYLPIPMSEEDDGVINLQSAEDENLSFVIMNPFFLKEDYNPQILKSDYKKLGTTSEEDLSYYVICVVREPVGESTINLKCPIVVNIKNRKALQVILEDEQYAMRHLLKEFKKKGD